MSAHLTTTLVNGRQGDPALLVTLPQHGRQLLFDCGDLAPLPPRTLHAITHIFLSHGHIDHLIGFDRLLRALVGQEARIILHGPPGIAARIAHKLQGYEWDLVDRIPQPLTFIIHEHGPDVTHTAQCRLAQGFAPEPFATAPSALPLIHAEPALAVRAALLAHHGSCLAFRLDLAPSARIDTAALAARGWLPGPWLATLKAAALRGDTTAETPAGTMPLVALADLVSLAPGASLAYVTDAADSPANRAAIIALARDVDTLFIEAPFLASERERAQDRAHLTADVAGLLARLAGAAHMEPFHLSPRHEPAQVLQEVAQAFSSGGSQK